MKKIINAPMMFDKKRSHLILIIVNVALLLFFVLVLCQPQRIADHFGFVLFNKHLPENLYYGKRIYRKTGECLSETEIYAKYVDLKINIPKFVDPGLVSNLQARTKNLTVKGYLLNFLGKPYEILSSLPDNSPYTPALVYVKFNNCIEVYILNGGP